MTPITINLDYFRFLTFYDRLMFIVFTICIYFNMFILRWYHLDYVLEWQQQVRDPWTSDDQNLNPNRFWISTKAEQDGPWNLVKGKKKIEESSKDEKLKKEKKEKKGGIKKDFKLIANSREGQLK